MKNKTADRVKFLGLNRYGNYHFIGAEKSFFWLSPLSALYCDLAQALHLAIDASATPLVSHGQFSMNHQDWLGIQKKIQCSSLARSLSQKIKEHLKTPEDKALLLEKLRTLKTKALIDQPANLINRLYFQMLPS